MAFLYSIVSLRKNFLPEAAAAFILRPFLRILKLLQTRKDTYTSKSTEIHFVQHGLLARACNNTF